MAFSHKEVNKECKWKLFSVGKKCMFCLISNIMQGFLYPACSTMGASSPSPWGSSFLYGMRPSRCSFPVLSAPCLLLPAKLTALCSILLSSQLVNQPPSLHPSSHRPRAHREVEITPPSSSFTSVTLPNHVSVKEPVSFFSFLFPEGP